MSQESGNVLILKSESRTTSELRSKTKTRKARPTAIAGFADQPLASHGSDPTQPCEGDGGSVLPNQRGPVNSSLTAAEPTFDRDNGIAYLAQRRRQIEYARLPAHLYTSLFPIASFADGNACCAGSSQPGFRESLGERRLLRLKEGGAALEQNDNVTSSRKTVPDGRPSV